MESQREYEIDLGGKYRWAVRILAVLFMGGIILHSILNPPETRPCNDTISGICPVLNLNLTFGQNLTKFKNHSVLEVNLWDWNGTMNQTLTYPSLESGRCNYPPECGYGFNPNLTCVYPVLCMWEGE